MDNKFYIKKFIRDDGAFLELDDDEILLAEENTFLKRANPDTTAVNFTENDGGEMLGQRMETTEQTVNGIILPKVSDYWALFNRLISFFKINHIYKVVYVKRSGGMFAIGNAWISSSLQISPTPYEEYSNWSIGLTIGDNLWREYTEDASGNETYANSVEIPLITSAVGGEEWNDVGLIIDEIGEVWIGGSGGIQSIIISPHVPGYRQRRE